MIEVVVFDFDGTLADSTAIKEDCLHRTVAGLSGGTAALAVARKNGGDRYRIFTEVARQLSASSESNMIAAQARMLTAAYTQCCNKGILASAERRGARQALAALRRRGLRLWVLSATPDRHLTEILRRRGLLRLLAGSYGSSVSKVHGLRRIMVLERADRRSVLLVGDGADDQQAASSMGVKFAAIVAEGRVHARGRFALRDLRPLVPLVDKLNGRRSSKV